MTQPSPDAAPGGASPIADLSYRHYDGVLRGRLWRWWTVALAGIRIIVRKWWFWALAVVSCWPYLVFAVVLYFQSRTGASMANAGMPTALPGQKYALQFYNAFNSQMFWLMLITLAVGAGSIASDNRTNAILVYLSKPVTKGDYVLGKWMGIFVPVFGVAVVPALALYVYCLLGYTSDGFLREEPWLILRVLGASAAAAAILASVMVGISAWCRSSLIAGAVHAGIYVATNVIAMLVWAVAYSGELRSQNFMAGALVQNASLPGIINSVGWNIYGVTMRTQMFQRRQGGLEVVTTPPPTLWIIALAAVALVAIGFAAARMRVRAVEVVKG